MSQAKTAAQFPVQKTKLSGLLTQIFLGKGWIRASKQNNESFELTRRGEQVLAQKTRS